MASQHERGTLQCPLCEAKLQGGHPVIRKWFKELKASDLSVHTSWVWRGEVDQNRFYKEGKSRVLFPNSKHNATLDGEPCSRAMDLFFIRPDGVPSWDPERLAALASFFQAKEAPLVWGGSWEKFADHPHFQLAESVKQADY